MSFHPIRLSPGDDLRGALEAGVTTPGDAAFVVSGIGSLSNPRLRFAGQDSASELASNAEILTLSGCITPEGAHLHMTVADPQGRVFGGHVVHGNRIRTTAEILLVRAADALLSRAHDPRTGYSELHVRQAAATQALDAKAHSSATDLMSAPLTDDDFRALECCRTQALVAQDLATIERLHAPDYQLITPAGKVFERAAYLAAIASGELRYLAWQIAGQGAEGRSDGAIDITVRRSGAMAIVRYPAVLQFPSGRQLRCWHTDSWEAHSGHWQAVWSQATVRP